MVFSQVHRINIVPGEIPPIYHAAKGDGSGRNIVCELMDGDGPAYPGNDVTASIVAITPDGQSLTANASLSTYDGYTRASFPLTSAFTAVAGRVVCRVKLTEGISGLVGTGKFYIDVEDLNT